MSSVLNEEFCSIEQHCQDDPLLGLILANKLKGNIDQYRKNVVIQAVEENDPVAVESYERELSATDFITSKKMHDMLTIMQHQYDKYQESLKKRRFSVDFDEARDAEVVIDERMEPSPDDHDELTELRKRLLGKKHDGNSVVDNSKSIDNQIQDHENVQENLIEDMTKLANSLKQGAVAFQNALEEDKKVLGAAEIGIQVASKGIQDISGKLKKYDKSKLGYIFYITTTLFMLVGLVLTFIIIKLFPAL